MSHTFAECGTPIKGFSSSKGKKNVRLGRISASVYGGLFAFWLFLRLTVCSFRISFWLTVTNLYQLKAEPESTLYTFWKPHSPYLRRFKPLLKPPFKVITCAPIHDPSYCPSCTMLPFRLAPLYKSLAHAFAGNNKQTPFALLGSTRLDFIHRVAFNNSCR